MKIKTIIKKSINLTFLAIISSFMGCGTPPPRKENQSAVKSLINKDNNKYLVASNDHGQGWTVKEYDGNSVFVRDITSRPLSNKEMRQALRNLSYWTYTGSFFGMAGLGRVFNTFLPGKIGVMAMPFYDHESGTMMETTITVRHQSPFSIIPVIGVFLIPAGMSFAEGETGLTILQQALMTTVTPWLAERFHRGARFKAINGNRAPVTFTGKKYDIIIKRLGGDIGYNPICLDGNKQICVP